MADRDANRELRARLDDVFGQYQRLRSGLDDLQEELSEVRATALSTDGLITVTVDQRGHLVNLQLDIQVYRALTPDELGAAIVTTTGQAVVAATEQVAELMAECLPPDSGAMRFVRDNNVNSLLRRQDRLMHPSSQREV